MARRLLLNGALVAVLLASISLISAAETAPAHGGGGKALTGKACTKNDAACVRCTKGKSKSSATTCLACSDNGLVPAELGGNGRCVCPAGTAITGSANTVQAVASSSSSKSSAIPAHGGGGSKKGKGATPRACSPCAVDAYAPSPSPVAASKCKPCPPGTFTDGAIASTTCFAPEGTYFNPATQRAESCPVDAYCRGGDIANEGQTIVNCPKGSSTLGTTGNSVVSACIVPPGSVYDPVKDEVVKCAQNSYCTGGPVDGSGRFSYPCPKDTTTSAPGASERSQCTVLPGFYWDGSKVQQCTAGNYCLGGSVEGSGTKQTPCGGDLTSNPGASKPSDCFPPAPVCPAGTTCGVNAVCNGSQKCVCSAGYYATTTAPFGCSECGANYYCPGGTADPNDRTPCPLGEDTNGLTTASSSAQCVVTTCDPCGGSASPRTYFVTGKAKSVYVANALNPTTATTPPEASLICTMPDSGEFADTDAAINDVAATSTGQLLIAGRPTSSNDNGFILLLDPSTQTAGQPCVYRKLLDISPAVAGLGGGPKSDIFYGTGGSAFVYTYRLSETGGVPSLTALGSADVSAVVGGAIGASDVTAAPGQPNLLYFTAGIAGFTIGLDASGNPDASKVTKITEGGVSLNAPAAWCNSVQPFAGAAGSKNAYVFDDGSGRRRRRSLLGGYPLFVNVGTTTMPVTGLSGAATLPSCSFPVPVRR